MCEDAPCCGCCGYDDGESIDPRAFDLDTGYLFDQP